MILASQDVVSCAFCNIPCQTLDKEILSTHSQLRPDCSQLTGHITRSERLNIPDMLHWTTKRSSCGYSHFGISENRSKVPEMAVTEHRESTFLTYWSPNGSNLSEDIRKFAEAGYFFKGTYSNLLSIESLGAETNMII